MINLKWILLLPLLSCTLLSAQTYDFDNIRLLSRWDGANNSVGVAGNRYSGCFGYESEGRQYALVCSADGTHIIEITNPELPIVRDYIAGARSACTWREIHVYDHYAYIVSDDAIPNAMQIVDLSFLPDSVHIVHQSDTILSRSHTLYIDKGHLYTSSVKYSTTSSSQLAVWDIVTDPARPKLLRKLDDDISSAIIGNIHDAISYNDTIFASVGYQGIFILHYDAVLNKFSILGSYSNYEGGGSYNHNSALLEDKKTLVFTDEVPKDLEAKAIDVTDITDIAPLCTFHSYYRGTPHNIYTAGFGSRVILSYYQDGIWIYDFTHTSSPVVTGYFDTHYQTVGVNHSYSNPGGAYKGNWGAYLYPSNKRLIALDMQNGLFVLDADTALGLVSTPMQEEKIITSIKVYPNPASDRLYVQYQYYTANSYTLLTPTGEIVQTGKIGLENTIPLQGLSKGIYFLKIIEQGEIFTAKFVKE